MSATAIAATNSKARLSLKLWDGLGLIVPLLLMSPLLLVEYQKLMNRPERQFFPLLIGIAVFFPLKYLWFHSDAASRPIALWRLRWSVAMYALGMLIFVVGAWRFSPWLVHVAAIVVFFAWGLWRCASLPWSTIAAWSALLLVTLPLPYAWDQDFINWLQASSSKACGNALDTLYVPYMRLANTIEIKGKKLFVEEACSGIGSMYALLAAAALLLYINGRSLMTSLLVLLTVPVWAMLGNFIRLLAIALGQEYYQRDLSHGFEHDVLGVITFSVAALGLWMTEWLISGLMQPIPPTSPEFTFVFQSLNTLISWPNPDPLEALDEASDDPDVQAARKQRQAEKEAREAATVRVTPWSPKSVRWIVGTSLSAGAIMGIMLAVVVFKSPGGSMLDFGLPEFSEQQLAMFPAADALPATLADWKRTQFAAEHRSSASMFGTHSHIWEYRKPDHRCLVSLDFPFRGEHPLRVCYQSSGWEVLGAAPIKDESQDTWDWQEIVMQNEFGAKGLVCYATLTENGEPYNLVASGQATNLLTRFLMALNIQKEDSAAVFLPICYQVQLICESGKEFSEAEVKELREHFFAIRRVIREKISAIAKK